MRRREVQVLHTYIEFVGLRVKTSYSWYRSKTVSSFLLRTPQADKETEPKMC